MRAYRYSRWDGSLDEFSMDAQSALEQLSDLMMEGLNTREALEWMREHGFPMAGMNMRVMGLQELVRELRDQVESLYEQYDMDAATSELEQQLDDILDREQEALRARHGFESLRMNDFLDRRHGEDQNVGSRIERMRDHDFEDRQAGEDFQELLDELERIQQLDDFLERRGDRFRGSEQADYETAQEIRERIEASNRWRATSRKATSNPSRPSSCGICWATRPPSRSCCSAISRASSRTPVTCAAVRIPSSRPGRYERSVRTRSPTCTRRCARGWQASTTRTLVASGCRAPTRRGPGSSAPTWISTTSER